MWGKFHSNDKQDLTQMANELIEATKEGDDQKVEQIKNAASKDGYTMTQVGQEVQIRNKWWK